MFDESIKTLNSVRYVPYLKRNLISIGQLEKFGLSCKNENGKIKVSRGSLVVLKAKMKNGLYELMGKTVIGESCSSLVVKEDKSIFLAQ